jgi:hypothetical protein
VRKLRILPRAKKGAKEERIPAAMNATSASLRSEDDEMKKRRGNDAPAAAYLTRKGQNHAAETKLQLTDHGHFEHDRNASVASLRPCPARRRNE